MRAESPQASARVRSGGAVALVALCLVARASADRDLSPRSWRPEELKAYGSWELHWGLAKPKAVGHGAMVVGTSSALAVRSGYEALVQGGSAVDAALTTALCQVTLSAGCWVSCAGVLSLIHYDAQSGEVTTLNAPYAVPRAESDPLTIPPRPTTSGRAVLVPGFMPGLEAAHRRFGRLPLRDLFDAPVLFAEQGFPVSPVFADFIQQRRDALTRLPEGAAIFLRPDGEPLAAGDILTQPALARTLRRVASTGPQVMTTGPWAREFVASVQREGGRLTLEDLADYSPVWGAPATARLLDTEVSTLALPSMGAVHLLEGLNLLELARPQQFGRHTLDAQALYWTMQCARLSYLLTTVPEARLREFLPEVPLDPETRATPESAARLWAYLQRPGWIQSLQGLPLPPEAHSDGVIAVDPQGDIAVLTHTNNTTLWGSTGLFVGGVSVPDSAAFQQKLVAAAGPGGGVAHNMSPAIAMRAGRPVLAADAVGGGLHEVMLQNLLNVLAYGLSPEQAVEAPVFGSFAWSGDLAGSPDYLAQTVREGAFPEELLAEVRALGQPIEVDDGRFASSRGYWIGVRLDPETRRLEGAVTPDLNGWAIGG